MQSLKETIEYEDFAKLDIRVGTIVSVEPVEGSSKLLKLQVNFGEEERQILTGMQKWYKPEDFEGKQSLFIVNLAPRKMMGLESQGMLLSIGSDFSKKPILILPSNPAENGDGVA
ncbi:MAG: methionine--tRNA ligase [Patescibacteria group bacterium]